MSKFLRTFFLLILIFIAIVQSVSAKEHKSFAAATAASKLDGKPAVIFFTATWCGPCKKLKSSTLKDRGVIAKLNPLHWYILDTDREKTLAKKYKITGLPTTKILKGEKEVKSKTGFMSPSEITRFLP